MKDIKEYSYWGGENEPPPNLKTKKQLRELGLSSREPVGFIHMKKKNYDILLYDINNPESVKPKRPLTEGQKQGLLKAKQTREYNQAKETFSELRKYSKDKLEVIYWAKEVLNHKDNYLILDTETTGLDDAEVVQIAIINLDGETLLNTLVKPTIEIPQEVIRIHGITNKMVRDAPTFPEIHSQIIDILLGKTFIIYNSSFDQNIIQYCCRINNLSPILFSSNCLMRRYAQYIGEWSNYWGGYKWQRLPDGDHSALGDCLAALKLLKSIAQTKIFTDEKQMEKDFSMYWFNREAIRQIEVLEILNIF